MTIKFLGQEFPNAGTFRAAFPAYSGDDAVRAVQAGCQTPLEVEQYCWKRRGEGMSRTLKAIRARTQVLNEKAAKARSRKVAKSRKAAA